MDILIKLYNVVLDRRKADPDESYVAKRFKQGTAKIAQKFGEDKYQVSANASTALSALPPAIPGDLNGDGKANCDDLAIIKASRHKKVGQPGFDIRADLNGDGVVNGKDVKAFRKLVGHKLDCDKYDDNGE